MKLSFKILLFVIIVLVGAAGVAYYWTFVRTLPDYNATLKLDRLQNTVNIYWDNYGVPHIYAKNEHDLYFSLGYVHAQDRLWQMTLTQMAAQGRFAEFLGKDLLPYDELQRTIGFWRIAKKIEAQLPDSSRRILQAYADGVNTYAKNHARDLPIEFTLAGMKPITWTVTHSIALARLMAWDLNLAWKAELNYSALKDTLSPLLFNQLIPAEMQWADWPTGTSSSSNMTKALLPLMEKDDALHRLLGTGGSHLGSNAWAVSASKTATGYPLLAGDPHLGLSMPGKWYEVHLNLNGKNLAGATIPGAPAVVLGQNDVLAWSLTNVMLDDTDFFEEAVNPADNSQYLLDSLAGEAIYKKFDIQQEVIKIKGANDTTFTRRLTKHGPVISDIYPDQKAVKNRIIAMRWTGQEITNEFSALLAMGWSHSFKAFQKAASGFKVPAQNVIYADTSGTIARLTLAAIPIRSGNPTVIRKGWDPAFDWQGYVPQDELPKSINPASGWVANANNPTAPKGYPHYISVYWEPDSRYDRIRQYLSQNQQLSPEAFQLMQNDSYSAFSKKITEAVLPVLEQADSAKYKTAISYLENWDYKYEPSETAASIMDAFLLRFSRDTFQDEMGAATYESFIRFPATAIRALARFVVDGSAFFDDVHTEQTENQSDIILKSMDEALAFLTQKFGSESFEWRWEKLHTLTLEPPLFGEAAKNPDAPSALKLIVHNLLSKGPFPVRGNSTSINNGEYRWTDPYAMVLGPSIRRIIDFSDMSKSLSILPTGQSGNPLSEFYGDQTESWLNGQYKFLYQDSTFFNENKYQTLTLKPRQQP